MALLTLVGGLAFQLAALGLPFALTFSVPRVHGRAVEIIREVRKAIGIRLVVAPLLAAALLALLLSVSRRTCGRGP